MSNREPGPDGLIWLAPGDKDVRAVSEPHEEAGEEPLVLPPDEMAAVRRVAAALDKIAARQLDEAANIVSGLILDEIGLDGHGEANRLWRIAAYLRERAKRERAQDSP